MSFIPFRRFGIYAHMMNGCIAQKWENMTRKGVLPEDVAARCNVRGVPALRERINYSPKNINAVETL